MKTRKQVILDWSRKDLGDLIAVWPVLSPGARAATRYTMKTAICKRFDRELAKDMKITFTRCEQANKLRRTVSSSAP